MFLLKRWFLRIASNVRAAWRSGGFHYRLCGLQTFNFPLSFLRSYCRRCAKPPVVGWPLCLSVQVCPAIELSSQVKVCRACCHFHYIVGLYSLFEAVVFFVELSGCTLLGKLLFQLHCRTVPHSWNVILFDNAFGTDTQVVRTLLFNFLYQMIF